MYRSILHWGVMLCTLALSSLSHAEAPIAGSGLKVPLAEQGAWEILAYSNIPANEVSFSREGLNISVDSSASPLIYPIEPRDVKAFTLALAIDGGIDFGELKQGAKKADDFVFRLGLVYEGEKRLNFIQRKIAASWVKRLYKLAPRKSGIDYIDFYNVYTDPALAGQQRKHPLSKLLSETFVFSQPEDGLITTRFTLPSDKRVIALWLSADGDDTGARFSVLVKDIVLH